MLIRCRGLNLYPGFESLPLRHEPYGSTLGLRRVVSRFQPNTVVRYVSHVPCHEPYWLNLPSHVVGPWAVGAEDQEITMSIPEQIKKYITSQPEPKRSDMQEMHRIILKTMPACKLWFLDGKNSEGKIVSNPNIGYGNSTIKYADGKTREFYQIGLSANTTGISVYIMGIEDKTYLAKTLGKKLGKASVTGYCIKFKTIADIDVEILKAAIRIVAQGQKEKS